MKVVKLLSAVFAAALLFSAAAFAGGDKNAKKVATVHLADTVTVEGKQLTPGDYKVQAAESGAQTIVNILKGKDTVVSVPAKALPTNGKQETGYGTTTAPDGSKQLTAIYVKGTQYDLRDGRGAGQASSGQQ